MLQGPCSFDGLQVGAHHIGDPADLGIAPEIIGRCLLLRPGIFQRFQRHIQADLVTMLETVGHCLGHAVDP
eukprot:3155-Eustigmatos_ZCMA.PRE.1